MSTLAVTYSYTDAGTGTTQSAKYTLTYSVSSTDSTTTLTLTSMVMSNASAGFRQNPRWTVIADGETLHTDYDGNYTFSGVSKSWSRGVSTTTKTLRLTVSSMSNTTSISVPASPTYTVTFNANGGTGGPSTQTKVHGQTLTLTTSKPTKTGYAFLSWNTNSSGTGTSYSSGGLYTANANITLYAIWGAEPSISSLTAVRCDSNGDAEDDGTYALVTCMWSLDGSQGDTATLSGTVTPQTGGSATSFTFSSGASGSGSNTAIAIIGQGNGMEMDTDMQYTISVTATSGTRTASRNVILTRAFFVMDWKAGGGGVGIGRAAPEIGLEVGYVATFDDWITAYKSIAAGEGSKYYVNTTGQLICGKYNYINSYPFIVGDGTSNNDRHNCFYIDSSGAFTALGSPTIKSTDMERDVSPGSSSKEKDLYFRDKNGNTFGWIGAIQAANSTNHSMRIVTQRTVNGTNKFHVVNVGIDIDGNAYAGISGNGAQAAWRNALGAVNKAGDTMTGPLYINTSSMDRDGANPSATQWGSGLTCRDKDSEQFAYFGPVRWTDGSSGACMYGYNEKSDGTQVANAISLAVAKDGTLSVSLTSPYAWRQNLLIREALCTRKLGTGGTAYAFRVGTLLIVSGTYTGCSISSTYTSTNVCEFNLSTLGGGSVTNLGGYAHFSGGGPSYQGGSVNTGGWLDGNKVVVQVSAAVSSKYLRFCMVGRIS